MAKVKDSQNKSERHGFKSQTFFFFFFFFTFYEFTHCKESYAPCVISTHQFIFFTSKIWLKTLEFTLKFHSVAFTQNLSMYIAHDIGTCVYRLSTFLS